MILHLNFFIERMIVKKINYRLIVLLIILAIVAYRFFTFKPPVSQQENFTRLYIENSGNKQNSKPPTKRSLQSTNFYANSEFAEFFNDVPCKDTYMLYNFFSELKNNLQVRQMTISSFAIELARMGLFDKALELAELIEDQNAYEKLVALLLEAGEVDKAIRVANSMKMYNVKKGDYFWKNGIDENYEHAMEHIVSYLAKNGEIERAIGIANSIGDSMLSRIASFIESEKQKFFISDMEKSKALRAISDELIDMGNSEKALNVANSMSTLDIKIETLCNIATQIIKSGQKSRGLEVFQSVIDFIDKPDSEFYDNSGKIDQARSINEVAFELAKAGEMELSKQIFEKSLIMNTNIYSNGQKICDPLTVIAIIKSGHYDWGIELADSFNDNWIKNWIFKDSALELIKMNKDEEAEMFINKAIDSVFENPQEDPYSDGFRPTKSYVCWEYAKELARVNKAELADQYFKKSIDLFKSANKRDELTDSEKENVITDFIYAGKIDWALEILDTLSPDYNKDFAYIRLASEYAMFGEIDKSLEYLDNIQDPKEKFYTLKEVTEKVVEQKNYSGFEKIFPKLLECADSYTDEVERNEFFFIICQILLDLPCEEQQKYIQKFVTAYDSGVIK
jgi:tetratricopeptide (TPR) repeat protein